MVRSQMAEAIYNKLTNSHDATSAGTYVGHPDEPEGRRLTYIVGMGEIIEYMKKRGMDIGERHTRTITPGMVNQADVVVSMAEEPFVPSFIKDNRKIIVWGVENDDPTEKKYNEIYPLVKALIQDFLDK